MTRIFRWLFLCLALQCGFAAAQQPSFAPQPSHLAVVLPLDSPSFKKYADAVLRGVLAAASLEPSALPVYVYETTEHPEAVLDAYDRAAADGAAAIIGPLTRTGVSALASRAEVPVPTLALNVPEGGDRPLANRLYLFGLQIESEARQIARYAFEQGKRSAFIIASASALERRIAEAFKDAWISASGTVVEEFEYSTGIETIGRLRDRLQSSEADMVFLALSEPRARFIRPYLTEVALFATSLVFSSTERAKLYDLEGITFVDMPWLLEADHPAVLTYGRPEPVDGWLDVERFQALGVDAYRLALRLVREPEWRGVLDGVTGKIAIDGSRTITRHLLAAQFLQGRATLLLPAPLVADERSDWRTPSEE